MLITLLLSYLQFSLFILLNISDIYVKSQGKSEIKPLLTIPMSSVLKNLLKMFCYWLSQWVERVVS